jgi:hypothetical protein
MVESVDARGRGVRLVRRDDGAYRGMWALHVRAQAEGRARTDVGITPR